MPSDSRSSEPHDPAFDAICLVDLTDEEREFIGAALGEWGGSATNRNFTVGNFGSDKAAILGVSSIEALGHLIEELQWRVSLQDEMSQTDWLRTLILTDVMWSSDIFGSGKDFPIVTGIPDEQAQVLLDSIQQKVPGSEQLTLLFVKAR